METFLRMLPRAPGRRDFQLPWPLPGLLGFIGRHLIRGTLLREGGK